jgi:ESCRT-II complex subunit VPS36
MSQLFLTAPLTVSGKPILLEGEIEIKVSNDIELWEEGNRKAIYQNGTFVLTNHRTVYTVKSNLSSSLIGWAIHFSKIHKFEDTSSMFSGAKLLLSLLDHPTKIIMKFSSSSIKDEISTLLQKQLVKKSWEQPKILDSASIEKFSVKNAGVGGLLRRQENEVSKVQTITKEALSDLDSLMASAKSVVNIVQRYAAVYQQQEKGSSSGGAGGGGAGGAGGGGGGNDASTISETSTEVGERNEMENILQNIGIISPVTKLSAGRLYHQELARQLADLLLTGNILLKMGGTATLADIYCIFNKARGTELVSPDDFLKASQSLSGLNVGLTLKKFNSGLLSITLISSNNDQNKVVALANDKYYKSNGITPSIVSSQLQISLIVAKELLLSSEQSGLLCRDDSIEGIFFFSNIFNTLKI